MNLLSVGRLFFSTRAPLCWLHSHKLLSFTRKKDGVSSVEFALLLPFMLTLYFGAVEISNALIADRKLNKTGNAVADLVAQSITIDDRMMEDIFGASAAIMAPFNPTTLSVVVTSVVADQNNNLKVAWSDGYNMAPYTAGASYTLPPGLTTPGSSVIVAEAHYTYTSPVGEILTGGLNYKTEYFLRPRRTSSVARVH
ncbi:MAG: pilus assembly protein [Alphaproteobacteria bacterium]|nr:pilus assembly protein [Rhodobiaceae bacterium]MBO6544275.1 pilus assembly protein [Alphaproteobacteria bacterium]MBO6627611.1 pilus assembly protein [Alphaproteobacteria bacterium]MDF1627770.1 pilus assembly protein [Parvibaculaceae bacterium]